MSIQQPEPQAQHGWRRMPKQFCNFERLISKMEENGLDGVVLNSRYNVYYMTGLWVPALQADEPYLCYFVFSRHQPDHPVVVVADMTMGLVTDTDTWVEDIRPYRMISPIQKDIPLEWQQGLDRFVPEETALATSWYPAAEKTYLEDYHGSSPLIVKTLKDLGLAGSRIGIDQQRLQKDIDEVGGESTDAFWIMQDVRHVKTQEEIDLLREATQINQRAQEHMVRSWQPGMSWREAFSFYTQKARELGGNTDSPAGSALNTTCPGRCLLLNSATQEDIPLKEGMNMMLDCHGMLSGYCWDGGKTWRVGEPTPEGRARKRLEAGAEALRAVNDACVPGATEAEVQAAGRGVLRKLGVPEADEALIVLHGLGLSHVDMDETRHHEWTFQENSVLPTHLYIPGDEYERIWLEDVVQVTPEGGKGMFTWDYIDWK